MDKARASMFDLNWDADGRLRGMGQRGLAPGRNTAYYAAYDASGERVSYSDYGTSVVDSFGLYEDRWASVGTPFPMPAVTRTPGLARREDGADRVFHSDWLGSTRNLTDSTGKNITSGLRFDGYGQRSAGSGSDGAYPAEYQWAGAWGYQREAPVHHSEEGKMRERTAFATSIILVFIAAGFAFGSPPPGEAADAVKPGLDLKRLKELQNPKLTPVKRANLGLRLYREEMLHPTPRPRPPYASTHTHDYVLAEITRKLADTGADVPTLRKAWETANPGLVKDSLSVFLLLKRQAPAREPVVNLLVSREAPIRLRELGVTALGKYAVAEQDASVGKVLAQVIREDTQGIYRQVPPAEGKGEGSMTVVYPVRRAAVDAIRKMQKEGLLLESYVTAAADQAKVEVPLPPARARAGTGAGPAAK